MNHTLSDDLRADFDLAMKVTSSSPGVYFHIYFSNGSELGWTYIYVYQAFYILIPLKPHSHQHRQAFMFHNLYRPGEIVFRR